jgi:hypothetical protein
MGETENACARQRLIADHETGVQHGARQIPGMVPAGAPARFHQGNCQRVAGIAGEPRPGFFVAQDEIQWERLDKLNSLEWNKCSGGKKGWRGYVVYEFLWSKRVVLECPVYGNATYVLSGDWKNMVGHSKLYLRTNFPQCCTKIVHKGEWLAHIKAAL